MYASEKLMTHEYLVTEANVLCERLASRAGRVLAAGDYEEYFRIASLRKRALARWRRRQAGATVRRPM